MTQHWTAEVDAEANALYATFSEAKIREFQDLAVAQMQLAYAKQDADAMEDLQRMHDALTREMLRRCPA